ncbi:21224_t:CDS:2 [Dentiscutata erythropus]|uniref:21224_t:CDS:1 n=1 Tax=Dentiscutata erythropus TaxID=1348616 RepID=A0A9N8Z3Y7_9GLOM|nr:21224_t:CDS:2 [Dentiscutata erythropus]
MPILSLHIFIQRYTACRTGPLRSTTNTKSITPWKTGETGEMWRNKRN